MSISVIMGSMFAGKTSELIRRVKRYQLAGKDIIVFKHSLDCQRNGIEDVISHDKDSINAIAISNIKEIYQYLQKEKIIAIDEVQFFDKKIIDFAVKMNECNKRVILAGLDMDYKGKPFGFMGDLCCIADDVIKLHAVCKSCGKNAKYSFRKSGKGEQIQVGGENEYIALCNNCRNKLI